MNGAHDLGGMHGLGPINAEPEAEEPVFHTAWEKRVFGLTLAAGFLGKWNIDISRHARERQHPIDYLRHTYYENWLVGLEKLLVEAGLVTAEELATGKAAGIGGRGNQKTHPQGRECCSGPGSRLPRGAADRSPHPASSLATRFAPSTGIRGATRASPATCVAEWA